MVNVSAEFLQLMQYRTDFAENATITFADGREKALTEDDFAVGDNKYTDAAGSDSLPLGVAIARTVQIELYNGDDRFADYDFVGARIHLYLTFQLSATVEKVELGHFTVIEPETYGETVTITAVDDMYRADKKWHTDLFYPTTLSEMYRECCDACGIGFESANFRNSTLQIAAAPDTDCTYREMLGYIAMLAVGNARINRSGVLQILEYDFSADADHTLTDWISLKTDTSNITVTGVSTKIGNDYDGETLLVGSEGYVLDVTNPLMANAEQASLDLLAAVLVGATWRKFDGDIPANPLIEFMDTVTVQDRKGGGYSSIVTDMDFVVAGATTISNSAESALRNQQSYSAPQNATYQAAKDLVVQERTQREAAVQALSDALGDGSGMYMTAEEQEDGSMVYYLHNKPTMAESQNIIKVTSEAIGMSTDGGTTYPFGFTVTGDMIAKILSAEGINADWITTGTLSARRIAINSTSTLEDELAALDAGLDDINTNGTKKVQTTTGFLFDESGLTVSKTDAPTTTHIDENGMVVSEQGNAVLTANNQGVDARNLRATTYLIIGNNSRFEDWGEYTACFWIGG